MILWVCYRIPTGSQHILVYGTELHFITITYSTFHNYVESSICKNELWLYLPPGETSLLRTWSMSSSLCSPCLGLLCRTWRHKSLSYSMNTILVLKRYVVSLESRRALYIKCCTFIKVTGLHITLMLVDLGRDTHWQSLTWLLSTVYWNNSTALTLMRFKLNCFSFVVCGVWCQHSSIHYTTFTSLGSVLLQRLSNKMIFNIPTSFSRLAEKFPTHQCWCLSMRPWKMKEPMAGNVPVDGHWKGRGAFKGGSSCMGKDGQFFQSLH